MATNPGVFQYIGDSVELAMNSFVAATSAQVIVDFLPIAVAGATIYFALIGYMIIAGRIQTPGGTLLLQAVKFLVLLGLAMSANGYNQWVVGSIRGLENGITQAFSTTGSSGGSVTVYGTLDETLGKGWDIAGALWERAMNRGVTELPASIGDYVNAIVIGLATAIVGLPAGAMIVVAKASLTLLLGIGPLFVMCLMWKPTARWFDAWFAQVMTAILTIALVAAVAAFMMKIFAAFIGGVQLDGDQNTLFTALSLAVLAAVLMTLLYKAGGLASGLAGGLSLGAITFGQMAVAAATGGRMLEGAAKSKSSERTSLAQQTIEPAYRTAAKSRYRRW